MTMNPFEQSTQQLLRFLTSHAEWEVIDYIRQKIQHDAPDSVPTADELLTFSDPRMRRPNWTPTNKCWRPTDCWSTRRSVCAPSAT